jgi:SAM-dependent methyltransferase
VPESLPSALGQLRPLLLDPHRLVRAVATGVRRGTTSSWERAELRTVLVKSDRQLQVVLTGDGRPTTRNVAFGSAAESTVDELLAAPFRNWHVQTAEQTVQLRVTKRGAAQVHRTPAGAMPSSGNGQSAQPLAHDRAAAHLLPPDDPIFDVIGGSAAKRRQVDAFLRALDATLGYGELPQPLRVVDLGCGNAYLTFATYRYLCERGLDVTVTGVDVRDDQRERNTRIAQRLGWESSVRFLASTIAEATIDGVDLVLALHACDTATDDALARAIAWRARWILAAPCCHHDVSAQLRRAATPAPYQLLTRHGIMRERLADVLTDSLRAALLRLHGYHVDVVEFVHSAHTPRNVLLRAARTGAPTPAADYAEYAELTERWQITPHLATLLRPVPQPRADSTVDVSQAPAP